MRERWRKLKQGWQAWGAILRRKRATAIMCVPLLFLLTEPLVCIFHCDVWMPMALRSSSIMRMHHDHMHMTPAEMAAMDMPETETALLPAGVDIMSACFMRGEGSDDLPVHMPPSPVHDALPIFLGLLAVALLCAATPMARQDTAPFGISPLHWRPPIPFAA